MAAVGVFALRNAVFGLVILPSFLAALVASRFSAELRELALSGALDGSSED